MMTLIIGGPGTGKSSLAEKLCLESGDERRYYLATMQVLDSEGEARVRRHRAMREGKGFVTLERPFSVDEAVLEMEDPKHTTVLLECVSNLVGNKMHETNPTRMNTVGTSADKERIINSVVSEIGRLSSGVHHLIAVTNDYPSDDPAYDEETRQYVHLLHLVNERLKKVTDRVVDLRKPDHAFERN